MKPLTLAEYKEFWSRFRLMRDLAKEVATAKEGARCWFDGIDIDGEIRYEYAGDGYVGEGGLKPEILFAEDPLSAAEGERAKKKAEQETRKKQEEALREERNEKRDRIEYERLKKKFA